MQKIYKVLTLSAFMTISGCSSNGYDLNFENIVQSGLNSLQSNLNSILSEFFGPKKTPIEKDLDRLSKAFADNRFKAKYMKEFPAQKRINEKLLIGEWSCKSRYANEKRWLGSHGESIFHPDGTFTENVIIKLPVDFIKPDTKYKGAKNNFFSYRLKAGKGKWYIDKKTSELYITVDQKNYFSKMKPAYTKSMQRKMAKDPHLKKLGDDVFNKMTNVSFRRISRTINSLTRKNMFLYDYTVFDNSDMIHTFRKLVTVGNRNPKVANAMVTDLNRMGYKITKDQIKLLSAYIPAATTCRKVSKY